MSSRIRPQLNHATVVAYLALFVALGGSSYAVVKLNGKNIKNKTIAGKKLKNRTITAGKVKRDTLTGAEINESALGQVPTAANAATATNAASAASATTLADLQPAQVSPGGGVTTDPDMNLSTSYETVLTQNIATARSAALLVSASVGIFSSPATSKLITCRLLFDGNLPSVEYVQRVDTGRLVFPVVGTQSVSAGTHTVALQCKEDLDTNSELVDVAGMVVSAHIE